ncbi:GTP-binding protein [Variovorax terrae]|uniref:ATP/GTP-binding protein n=1 Tax=Variovorax terrae TaxID=2923278 RepID=A0A9X1VTE7_9BURK|nr:ATP/GTP-binding protein [Variovorax terrae]MCJ0762972.1 ATP/GTP-binding protein [Variovorax terrae]
MTEHKLLFTGTVGAGKTTAIGVVSEIPPLTTDVRNHDTSVSKALTTVGLDYGELTLSGGDKLRLYGTPGQLRFGFMWQILGQGALGLVILIDNRRPDPLADLDVYITGFADLIAQTACVVAVGRMETHPSPDIEQFADRLASRGVLCPVLPADVRRRDEVVQLLDLLLTQLEVRTE